MWKMIPFLVGILDKCRGVVLFDEGESEIPVMRAVQCGERRC